MGLPTEEAHPPKRRKDSDASRGKTWPTPSGVKLGDFIARRRQPVKLNNHFEALQDDDDEFTPVKTRNRRKRIAREARAKMNEPNTPKNQKEATGVKVSGVGSPVCEKQIRKMTFSDAAETQLNMLEFDEEEEALNVDEERVKIQVAVDSGSVRHCALRSSFPSHVWWNGWTTQTSLVLEATASRSTGGRKSCWNKWRRGSTTSMARSTWPMCVEHSTLCHRRATQTKTSSSQKGNAWW